MVPRVVLEQLQRHGLGSAVDEPDWAFDPKPRSRRAQARIDSVVSCAGKCRHATRSAAQQEAVRLMPQQNTVYRCRVCRGWHIAGKKRKERR